MDSETKMNVANALIWVSVITCALAIASIIGMLCISTDSPKEMQTDIQVDVLSILVTVLIGWNICKIKRHPPEDEAHIVCEQERRRNPCFYDRNMGCGGTLSGKRRICPNVT